MQTKTQHGLLPFEASDHDFYRLSHLAVSSSAEVKRDQLCGDEKFIKEDLEVIQEAKRGQGSEGTLTVIDAGTK